jgi:hypothetical protein
MEVSMQIPKLSDRLVIANAIFFVLMLVIEFVPVQSFVDRVIIASATFAMLVLLIILAIREHKQQ